MKSALAPSGVYRLDRRRTISLNFQPPEGMALSDVMHTIRTEIEPKMKALLPPDGRVSFGAAANHLDNALWTMGKNFVLAVLLLFLIMAALFKSMRDAAIATIALPLGTVGGVAALRVLGLFVFQPLDLLTMIGFIIVLGLVVNNTILLVARTRQAEAEGMSRVDAVRSSLETRLRPIFSSTLTAIFGMLPLVLVPGPGAEIYRGLGAVIVGGMLVSHRVHADPYPRDVATRRTAGRAPLRPRSPRKSCSMSIEIGPRTSPCRRHRRRPPGHRLRLWTGLPVR